MLARKSFPILSRDRYVAVLLHSDSNRPVVGVEGFGVLCAARGSELLSGGQQRADVFVSQNDQGGESL